MDTEKTQKDSVKFCEILWLRSFLEDWNEIAVDFSYQNIPVFCRTVSETVQILSELFRLCCWITGKIRIF